MGIAFGDYRYEGGLSGFGAVPDDKPLGRQILQMYHAAMSRYPVYKSTIDSQLNQWSKNNAKVKEVIIDGIGTQGRVSGLTLEQMQDAMNTLARKQRGVVPGSYQDLGTAIGYRAANPTIWETVSAVSKESAKDIASGAQMIGKDVIGTYKMAKFLLPVAGLAIIAGLFYRAKGGSLGMGGLVTAAKKKLQLNPRVTSMRKKDGWLLKVGKDKPVEAQITKRRSSRNYSDPVYPSLDYEIDVLTVNGDKLNFGDLQWQPSKKRFHGETGSGILVDIYRMGAGKKRKRKRPLKRLKYKRRKK